MKRENLATILTFLILVFSLTILSFLLPDKELSLSERRKLKQKPDLSFSRLFSGDFMPDYEGYLSDQFPYREEFRSLKALTEYKIYRKKDNNGIYLADGFIGELEDSLNEKNTQRFTQRLLWISDRYLNETNRIFYAVIPDKNYFLAALNGYPSIDYDRQLSLIQEQLPSSFTYINLFPTLTLEDYYRTDTHWRCEALQKTAEMLASKMNPDRESFTKPEIQTFTDQFYGVYYGRAALPVSPEPLRYIETPTIRRAVVTDFDKNVTGGIYNKSPQNKLDAYSFFLNGSSSLITIENPLTTSTKELILFRDSFASSLAPWLVEAYRKITLIDIRYIAPEILERFVSFEHADVLFLYSTLVINHADTFKL